MIRMSSLSEIVSKFAIQGKVKEIKPWGNGNINDTYRVINEDKNFPDYILQRVNDDVFTDVEKLMDNQMLVINHVVNSSPKVGNGLADGIFQPPIQRLDNDIEHKQSYLYHDEEGWWRMSEFALSYTSYDQVPDITVAKQAGTTIGHMVVALSTFHAQDLHETIPHFHNINKRMEQLNQAWEAAAKDIKDEAKDIMNQIQANAHFFQAMHDSATSGALPLRATHNDTKFNNLLFHPDNDIGKVIDLDTLMPGYSFFDIGDVLRSGMVLAAEDETDLTKVKLNKGACNAFIDAFVNTARSVLTQKEISYIPLSGAYMSFMLSTRFLADYLNGNVYFKTNYPRHNFDRACCQLKVSDVFRESL